VLRILLFRLLDVYEILIVIEVVLSWLLVTGSPFIRDAYEALARLVEPYVGLFRRILPPFGGIDFSPVVAVVVLRLLQRFLF
jgi:uncharacterized protein YggT (Ycf19 family)